ncbi:MAG: 1-acyl-sn-glycerol-3-phosphate acyltransferase [Propionibacterium sp.]|nr:MAG: 1-acyl-sn-glycerol-3-phosphate acyltransferase [Propionibacterium sp.]
MQLVPLEECNTEVTTPTFRRLAKYAHWLLNKIIIRDWRDHQKIPKTGGVIFVSNHIGNFDVLVLGEFLIWGGRWPHFLGKSDIFKFPVLGWLARSCEQIRVDRNTDKAKNSLIHAEAALAEGKAVAIYPEGTITGDPDVWPMTARTGAARLALKTGVPIVPIGQMGAQLVLGQKRLTWPRLFPKKTMQIICGDPIDLSEYQNQEITKELLQKASTKIMDEITSLVEILRQEKAPELRYDIRKGERVPQQR